MSAEAEHEARPGGAGTCAPDGLAATPSDPPLLSLTWESEFSLDATVTQPLTGRLRAGIVLGLRLHRGSDLRDVVVRRILMRLHAKI